MSAALVPEICRRCSQLIQFKDPHGCAEFDCRARHSPEKCEEARWAGEAALIDYELKTAEDYE